MFIFATNLANHNKDYSVVKTNGRGDSPFLYVFQKQSRLPYTMEVGFVIIVNLQFSNIVQTEWNEIDFNSRGVADIHTKYNLQFSIFNLQYYIVIR